MADDPFALVEQALRFYADTPTDDGLNPPGPNAILAHDAGQRARLALHLLAEIELDICQRNMALLQKVKEVTEYSRKTNWPGFSGEGVT